MPGMLCFPLQIATLFPTHRPMTPAHDTPEHSATWFIPVLRLQLADGSTLIKPCKAVARGTAEQVSRWTGISTKTLARLAESGFIRCSKPRPRVLFYYPGEIEEFIAKPEVDPDYWCKVKRDAYITSRRLREKATAPPANPAAQ